jgi:hypothetical protein
MRLRHLLLTVVLTASGLFAQDNMPPLKGDEQAVVIPVKTLTGDSFRRLGNMLRVFKVNYYPDEKLRTILVYASPQVIEQIRKVVAELDRPESEAAIGRNIEMTLTFLRCGATAQPGASDLPTDLESVAKQLRSATQCKSVELWDSIPLRLQEGRQTEQNLRLPGSIPGTPSALPRGQLRILPESISRKDTGRYVRFERLNIGLTVPYVTSPGQYQNMEVSLNTAGDFKEGQKTILGKLTGAEDAASVFVVVALKVLD